MTKTFPILLGVVALLATPTFADARPEGRAMLPGFEQLDRNGTGSLSLEDFRSGLQERRTAGVDTKVARLMEQADADGKLDEVGLRAGFAALAEDRQAMRDGNEARRNARGAEMTERMFSQIDTDENGVIDAQEYAAFTTRMAERMEHRGPRGKGRWGMQGRD